MPAVLSLVDALLLLLALYFIQEGQAQRARPDAAFFVDFPDALLPLGYAAVILLVPTIALMLLATLRRLPVGRGSWIASGLAILALLILTIGVGGPDAVWTIVDPSH